MRLKFIISQSFSDPGVRPIQHDDAQIFAFQNGEVSSLRLWDTRTRCVTPVTLDTDEDPFLTTRH